MSAEMLPGPGAFFPQRELTAALKTLGDYVYGYYRLGEPEPFYVGKGRQNRVLNHWQIACRPSENKESNSSGKYKQYEEIRKILRKQLAPTIKILAARLEQTKREEVYQVVERVLQNTFVIIRASDKFTERLNEKRHLIQIRNDGRKFPVLSLEAAYCQGVHSKMRKLDAKEFMAECEAPVLLVGGSGSYHPRYSQDELGEMARKWWALDRLKSFQALRSCENAVLANWQSKFGDPQIVGIWRIAKGSFRNNDKDRTRYACAVNDDRELRKKMLGVRLAGTGQQYQGPRILIG